MINAQTRAKIVKFFYETYKTEIDEAENLINDFSEWFEKTCIQDLYSDTEKKIVREWESSDKTFPVLCNVGSHFYFPHLSEMFEMPELCRNERLINIPLSATINEFFHDESIFRVHLSKKFPMLKFEVVEERLRGLSKEKFIELSRQVRYIYEFTNEISKKLKFLTRLLDREDLTLDKIKKYSPNLYEKVWKN